MAKTLAKIDELLEAEKKLKQRANMPLMSTLEDIKSSIQGNKFSDTVRQRTTVIEDLKEAGGMNPQSMRTRDSAKLQAIKSAMDDDMLEFAKANDRGAAAEWARTNRGFADAYTKAKDTELRQVLMRGDATPEVVLSVIKRGKPSELGRLYKSLDDPGRESARLAILQDALTEAKYFDIDAPANPDRFVNAMNRANRQKAVKVFFQGDEAAQLKGLTRVLHATRRAQQSAAAPQTGQSIQLWGPVAGAGLAAAAVPVDAGTSLMGLLGASAVIKAYESAPVRQLLLKLGNAKTGSSKYRELMDAAATAMVAASGGNQDDDRRNM